MPGWEKSCSPPSLWRVSPLPSPGDRLHLRLPCPIVPRGGDATRRDCSCSCFELRGGGRPSAARLGETLWREGSRAWVRMWVCFLSTLSLHFMPGGSPFFRQEGAPGYPRFVYDFIASFILSRSFRGGSGSEAEGSR